MSGTGERVKKAGIIVSTVVLGLAWAGQVHANNRIVVRELTKLKSTLAVNDPQRTELSLRIADRLVDEAMTVNAPIAQAQKDRVEALALYQEVLPKVTPGRQTKVRFQMARLYLEQNNPKAAQPLLEQVYTQSEQVELKRESALRLAEILEIQNPKAAENYYQQTLAICQGTDSCSYAHYRMGWIHKNAGNRPAAIEELKQALWDSKGQIREEALRDLLVEMGSDTSTANVASHTAFMETVAQKANKPTLVKELAFAYLGAGNKAPAVQLLKTVVEREPSIDLELRYLEELYGVGPWDQFQSEMARFSESVTQPASPLKMDTPEASEKIALRMAIQLDGDRTTRPERTEAFQKIAIATVTLFPKSKERIRLMEGWAASEQNVDVKLAQLASWISSPVYAWNNDDKIKLLELRINIAQKANRSDDALADLAVLQTISPKREYRYAHAYALYQKKDFATALPIFKDLAADPSKPQAVEAQNLALDILNQQKDLTALQAQAKTWLSNPTIAKNPALAKDLAEMREISQQADFEQAVALGESDEALKRFGTFCEEKRFLPRSCENAKTLAIKMNRHPYLISALKQTGPSDVLNSEYEIGGYFKEAAAGYEKAILSTTTSFGDWIKVALMYDLGGARLERDRVLSSVIPWSERKKLKPSEGEELALASMMADAGLLDAKLLKSSWSAAFKARVAESLETRGKGNADTRKILLSQTQSTGESWTRVVREEIDRLVKRERAVSFHGRNGEQKFQSRVAMIREIGTLIEKYSGAADSDLRAFMLGSLKTSHDQLASEIISSPIPPGLNADQETRIRESLAEMAKPFQERATEIGTMLTNESAKPKSATDQVATNMSSAVQTTALSPERSALIEKMHQNPRDTIVLSNLRDLHRGAHQERLALYFEGRIQQLTKETQP